MKYTVKAGDNLWTLAKRAGIPLSDLLAQVPESVRRDPRRLQPGMVINLGKEQPRPYEPPPASWSGAVEPVAPIENAIGGLAALKGGVAGLGAAYRGYRGIVDDAAQADRDMTRYANAEGRGLARDTMSDRNPVIRQMVGSQPGSISPNLQRMYANNYRGTNAGWNNNPLGGAGSGGEATLFRPHPSRTGTSIGPHPDRGMVAAPARDINRAIEANPNMTLEELAGWLRNNPRQMTSLERDIESMQPSDFNTWLQNRYNPRQ